MNVGTTVDPPPASTAMPPVERPLRVLHVYSGNLFGGVERTFVTHVVHPNPAWRPEFALCFGGRLRDELRRVGGVQHDLGPVRLREPWTVVRARARLRALLARESYDVVVSHAAWGQFVFGAVIRESDARFVFYLHDIPNTTHLLERLARPIIPEFVLCNSRFTMARASRIYPGVPAAAIYPAVATADAKMSESSRRQLRQSLATPDDHVVIVQASRMQAWKGQALLLDALARLDADSPAWTCWIAGGPQRPEERAFFAELAVRAHRLGISDRVRFLGQRSDIAQLFGSADVFCQPNLAPEPFGVVFIEALRAGLPVVSTRMGGAEEIVDGTCGQLAEPDAASVASCLSSLLRDPAARRRLGRAGPARADALADPVRQVRAMVDAFRTAGVATALGSEERAALAGGESGEGIRQLVSTVVRDALPGGCGTVVDLGCGTGGITGYLVDGFERYTGCDLVAYDSYPAGPKIGFVKADLNVTPYPFATGSADLVMSIETVEHLENPRALLREMARIARPGGRILVSTPNQLSVLSKGSLLLRNRFNAFQGRTLGHITALLEDDLRLIARECGLVHVRVHFTDRGRVPLTARSWPSAMGFRGRLFSDNLLLSAMKPESASARGAHDRRSRDR